MSPSWAKTWIASEGIFALAELRRLAVALELLEVEQWGAAAAVTWAV
jgi:hypothetical protein